MQPYVALGMALRRRGHYVRVAAHEVFRGLATEHGLDLALLAGDPKELLRMVTEISMAHFVRQGVSSHRARVADVLDDAWDACTLPDGRLAPSSTTRPRCASAGASTRRGG